MTIFEGTIHEPKRKDHLPKHAQWLSGTGAGTWFCLDFSEEKKLYRVRRYNPDGFLECDRFFDTEDENFDYSKEYKFTYISHCSKISIYQGGKIYQFLYIKEYY